MKSLIIILAFICSTSAEATPFRIGTILDTVGEQINDNIDFSQERLNIERIRSLNFDTTFFNQIDAVIYLNAFGSDARRELSVAEQNNLFNFVLGGGNAYLGVGAGNSTPFPGLAALFGITYGTFIFGSETGVVQDPTNPLVNGPFETDGSYVNTFFRALSTPTNGTALGRSPVGTTLVYFAEGALAPGSGQVYFFADEVSLFTSPSQDALLANALVSFGASQIPEPGPLAGLGLGLLGLCGFIQRRRRTIL